MLVSALRCWRLGAFTAVVACAGLGEEPERIGPPRQAPGDPETPELGCSMGLGDPACTPAQLLIVLDRSVSMVLRPEGTLPADVPSALVESKWALAIGAIEQVVRGDAAARVAFGIELFPRDPGQGGCATVAGIIGKAPRLTAMCRPGALLVPPCVGAAQQVDAALDPATTTLCGDTPIAGALTVARDTLLAVRDPAQAQFLLLVTDGGDTCDWKANAVAVLQELRRAGIRTFAVGFGGYGVDAAGLSDLACAGGTAPDPESACLTDAAGDSTWDPAADHAFLLAEDGPALARVMAEIAAEIECVQIR